MESYRLKPRSKRRVLALALGWSCLSVAACANVITLLEVRRYRAILPGHVDKVDPVALYVNLTTEMAFIMCGGLAVLTAAASGRSRVPIALALLGVLLSLAPGFTLDVCLSGW